MRNLTVTAAAVLALAGWAAAEEETAPVKVYVKGMSCPTGCGARVTKGLQGIEGVRDVKLTDFEAGLFTLAFDPKASLKPSVLEKAVGAGFEVTRIEATLTGTVERVEKALVLTTSSGVKYTLLNAGEEACCEAKPDATKKAEEPKKETAKKDDACECCAAKNVTAKIEGFLKEGKTTIKASGALKECCAGTNCMTLISAIAVEPKKVSN
ncbi:MAG TPA: heavy-metal-associated domain-containing protein [Planctomycetota bacterium]|nr:heavy-metal-associated domain-containing protein [Planctomycetota bacterium]